MVAVKETADRLGLGVRTEVLALAPLVAVRRIDLVLHRRRDAAHARHRVQVPGREGDGGGEIPATIQDIAAWPIPGIVVFDGDGSALYGASS